MAVTLRIFVFASQRNICYCYFQSRLLINHTGIRMTPSPKRPVPNRLADEKSPYLLQHARNPVDWFPWGDEAFQEAARLDRPVFLSIGYSTCHWCHVMAHESFEDGEAAKHLNETFICIKVDREERPDIDMIYMQVCQIMSGSGGWPLTVILTPDRKPFYACTYLPKAHLVDLARQVAEIWQHRRGDIAGSSERVVEALRRGSDDRSAAAPDTGTLHRAFVQLTESFDDRWGGFTHQPKFPTPHNLLFLLRYWHRTGSPQALGMVEKTLDAMRAGGLFDHLGFGFHRYSTDRQWLVPHFEKMLYDQALLVMAYTEAYQATGRAAYRQTAEEVIEYVLRDMRAPEGAFYSAEDADSEGVEGKFYVWTEAEIRDSLDEKSAALVIDYFGITAEGNFRDEAAGRTTERNILHAACSLEDLARRHGSSEETCADILNAARRKLFQVREARVRPHRDDKILTDWNGLMIAALAKAGRAFDNPVYTAAAATAAEAVLHHLSAPEGRLYHRFREGHSAIDALLDDYMFLTWGLVELYEAVFEAQWLERALDLTGVAERYFWDSTHGGFYFSPSDSEALIARPKEIYDGAVPSGNAAAQLNLIRLARMTGSQELEERAAAIGTAFAEKLTSFPQAYTFTMTALEFTAGDSCEVVIAGNPGSNDTRELIRTLQSIYLPNAAVMLRPTDTPAPRILSSADYLKDFEDVNGKAAAYICRNRTCQAPVSDAGEMLKLLGKDG